MDFNRKIAVIVGLLFITATAATILSQTFLTPIIDAPDFFQNVYEEDGKVILGILFEFVNAFACVGIGISIFPVFKKCRLSIAVGYVCFRTIESTLALVASISLLSLLTVSREYARTGNLLSSGFVSLGTWLLSAHDWTFFMVLIAFNLGALMLYYLLYRARLVPRFISIWGLGGALLLIAANLLKLFGHIGFDSSIFTFLSLPIALNEMVLAVWLVAKGFNPSAVWRKTWKTV